MNGHDQDKLEGVLDRRFHFSGTDELFQRCSGCNRFLARCSGIHPRVTHETGTQLSLQVPPVCHHWPVVLVDGVVVEAGTTEARGGIGYVYGTGAEDQESLRVDTEGFGFGVPTAQKVELLAAILALRNFEQREPDETTCAMDQGDNFNGGAEIVVASNSEYLTRGITEWFPRCVPSSFVVPMAADSISCAAGAGMVLKAQ